MSVNNYYSLHDGGFVPFINSGDYFGVRLTEFADKIVGDDEPKKKELLLNNVVFPEKAHLYKCLGEIRYIIDPDERDVLKTKNIIAYMFFSPKNRQYFIIMSSWNGYDIWYATDFVFEGFGGISDITEAPFLQKDNDFWYKNKINRDVFKGELFMFIDINRKRLFPFFMSLFI